MEWVLNRGAVSWRIRTSPFNLLLMKKIIALYLRLSVVVANYHRESACRVLPALRFKKVRWQGARRTPSITSHL